MRHAEQRRQAVRGPFDGARESFPATPKQHPDPLALISDRTGDWDIYVMNVDGSSQQRVAVNSGLDCAPAWSPDGKRIVWESHTSGMIVPC